MTLFAIPRKMHLEYGGCLMKIGLKAAAAAMACVMALGLTACGSSSDDKTTYKKLKDTDDTVYKIGIVQSGSRNSDTEMTQGFTDALQDTFGEKHVQVTTENIGDGKSADAILSDFTQDSTQLILADGEPALTAASIATDTIPIVGVNVKDFQSTLHIFTADNKSWNRKTGRNITGISSAPNMPQTLSLMIEATPELKTVGILYAPEDTNAIFLNERLEAYLNQAGIPWKEYEFPSSGSAEAAEAAQEASNGSAIQPNKKVAASAKEGTNDDVQSIGDNGILSGINSSSAVRSAKISKYWYGGKSVEKPLDFTTNEADQTPYVTNLPEGSSSQDVINYAIQECSVLYISADSYLDDQAPEIAAAATAAGVSTVSGDLTAGESTLTSLYTDYYNQGYEAGKYAYRILVDGENPGSIAVKGVSSKTIQKLYQDTVATQLGMTFPKSFEDIDTFNDSHVPGSFTTRETTEDKDD